MPTTYSDGVLLSVSDELDQVALKAASIIQHRGRLQLLYLRTANMPEA